MIPSDDNPFFPAPLDWILRRKISKANRIPEDSASKKIVRILTETPRICAVSDQFSSDWLLGNHHQCLKEAPSSWQGCLGSERSADSPRCLSPERKSPGHSLGDDNY